MESPLTQKCRKSGRRSSAAGNSGAPCQGPDRALHQSPPAKPNLFVTRQEWNIGAVRSFGRLSVNAHCSAQVDPARGPFEMDRHTLRCLRYKSGCNNPHPTSKVRTGRRRGSHSLRMLSSSSHSSSLEFAGHRRPQRRRMVARKRHQCTALSSTRHRSNTPTLRLHTEERSQLRLARTSSLSQKARVPMVSPPPLKRRCLSGVLRNNHRLAGRPPTPRLAVPYTQF